jgi:predicted nucleic acid-binding protein
MIVFTDTSALLAILDRSEQNNASAHKIWRELIQNEVPVWVTSYVLVETISLLQRRFGLTAVHAFQDNIRPYLQFIWVDELLHNSGMMAVLTANRRQLSLVDCVSFAAMRQSGLNTVFAFDEHFAEQGFTVLE